VKTWPAVVLLAVAVAFQVTTLPVYRAGSVAPDFPFLALVYLGFFAPRRPLLVAAAITACVIDIVSLDPLGARLAGYLPALALLNRGRRTVLAESQVLRAGLTLVACCAAFLLEAAFVGWKEGRWIAVGFELRCAVYTTIIGVAVHAALDAYRARLGWVRDRFFAS
jgi:cell shape-determining protein MreD